MLRTTLVLGASGKPSRFSYLAVRSLVNHGHRVVAVGARRDSAHGVEIETTPPSPMLGIDTITLYLNPNNQEGYLEYIVSCKPRRIIFNPGSENPKLLALARNNGIEVVFGCTLVMLKAGSY